MELQRCHAGTLPSKWSTWRNVEAIDLAFNRLSGELVNPTELMPSLHGDFPFTFRLSQALCPPWACMLPEYSVTGSCRHPPARVFQHDKVRSQAVIGSWLMVSPTQQNNCCALQLIACLKHEQTSEGFDPT